MEMINVRDNPSSTGWYVIKGIFEYDPTTFFMDTVYYCDCCKVTFKDISGKYALRLFDIHYFGQPYLFKEHQMNIEKWIGPLPDKEKKKKRKQKGNNNGMDISKR